MLKRISLRSHSSAISESRFLGIPGRYNDLCDIRVFSRILSNALFAQYVPGGIDGCKNRLNRLRLAHLYSQAHIAFKTPHQMRCRGIVANYYNSDFRLSPSRC